ncbi:phosphoribosylaminoimidazolesuccinocarboxamide synthase [Candidatus Woesearchaeota archaeon CG11_big_fil_rev_8_21_14_0_20_43_8]|nr:MAG: phosphoribosylaminoimidazolesuccinocarboxamide synthase [Candidatus Woesearchaeota archaeon CG11_big_fil_rev_8_21_14_0_20_43_8]PIO05169.1 MAG: phosphoribosylaminoimidazolesuccinocarboxamide synthase [Candidatus Woesearchaeota archaeon CG08_land_8_20_14_0_20_43_7]
MTSVRKIIERNLLNTLGDYYIPELGDGRKGKVRDNFIQGDNILMVASDRISCFDHILRQKIPFKGQVLTQIARFWFENTSDIIENHMVSCPDPNAMLVRKCTPLPVEVVVRGFLTGSAWRAYRSEVREFCGVALPDGLSEDEAFDHPIVTPTTKEEMGHDIEISSKDIVSKRLVDAKIWKQVEDVAVRLFIRGQEICRKAGLILVDTKYEFGLLDGKLVLIDEIHTPDSSRFWAESGVSHKSKEFVRAWLIDNGFMGRDGEKMPDLPDDIVVRTSEIYCELLWKLAGRHIVASSLDINERLLCNLKDSGLIKGFYVAVLMGSESDMWFAEKICSELDSFDIPYSVHVASAHKDPARVLSIVSGYNRSIEPIVYITIAGRSNGLSGVTAAAALNPVIACPPFKDKSDYLVNIHSTLQMPSGTPVLTVVDPKNAALAVARIFANSSVSMRKKMEKMIISTMI